MKFRSMVLISASLGAQTYAQLDRVEKTTQCAWEVCSLETASLLWSQQQVFLTVGYGDLHAWTDCGVSYIF